MPPPLIAPFLISSAVSWVAKHHADIIPIAHRTKDFLEDVLAQGGLANTVQRVGNTVIWNRPDGASHVIGLLDQIDGRIDGLDIAQNVLQAGLSGLKNLSMVTLGFSGISVGLLASQFVFLSRKLNQIQNEIKRIGVQINQVMEAPLKSSLDYLEAADASTGESRLHNYREALTNARTPGHYFCDQATSPDVHKEQLPLIQFYSRKYFFALSVELASLIGLEQTEEVRKRLNTEEKNLKAIASQVFKHTLAKDVEAYLAPEMMDVATLEGVSGILAQAQNLGCISRDLKVTPAGVFEANRKNIFAGGIRRLVPTLASSRRAAVQKLQTAQGTFEEVTRLLSWREACGYLAQHGRSPTEVAQELRQFREQIETPTSSTPFVAYCVTPTMAS